MFKKKIVRQDETNEFIDICTKAGEHSEDHIEQLEYYRLNGTKQQYLLGLLTVAQIEFSSNPLQRGNKVELTQGSFEYLMRGFLDTARHMQSDLPDGVYSTILGNIERVILKALEDKILQP